MKKVVLVVFNGDPLCFIHVLLNALDMKHKGYDARIVMEGAATKLIPELAMEQNPLHVLWNKARNSQIIDGVCRACSNKMGVLKAAEDQGLKLLDDMAGHPGMALYLEEGFEIITF
ncbi:MAG: cytoplasmic protein [Desulfobacterales bacterium]|nr:cytoplasmic protein [Desulfobacterales bacterium]